MKLAAPKKNGRMSTMHYACGVTKMNMGKFDDGDPNRILALNLRQYVDRDAMLNAVADNLAYDPNGVHRLETLETTNPEHGDHKYALRLEFRNVIGDTEPVGNVLDALNMRDWRMVCDRFLCVMLEIVGRNPEEYDWPTPKVKVTYSGDPDADDLTTAVQLEWDVDEATYLAATSYEQFNRKRPACRKNARSGRNVWILVRRYEWEDHAQQTEYCDVYAFGEWYGAIRKAASLLRQDIKKHGDGVSSDIRCEEKAMLADFRTKFPRHLVQLTDGDNVVYELYRRSVGA